MSPRSLEQTMKIAARLLGGIRRVLEPSVRIALILLIAVHLVLVTLVVIEKRALRLARAHYDGEHAGPAVLSSGFKIGGLPVEFMRPGYAVAVRYASSQCGFSAKDQEWKALAAALQQRGIPVVVVLPRSELAFPEDSIVPSGAPQVAYVSADWIRRYPLTITPTLLIFDAERRVVWHREGVLRPADMKAAIQAIDASKMRP